MSWWGKLFGGTLGYMLGGPLGALIGAALGHNLDARRSGPGQPDAHLGARDRVQTAFFTATFSVMGYLAKADGRVSEEEIRLAESVMAEMQLNSALTGLAKRLFREGKQPEFTLDDVLDQLKRECHNRHSLLRIFIEILLQAAYADGVLHAQERVILLHVCDRLGFSRGEFDRLETMVRAARAYRTEQGAGSRAPPRGADLAQAYAILSVPRDASDADVKKAYRRLMNQHHPDKLVAKGLPEEMMKLATQKTHEIRAAYDRVRAARGF